MNNSQDYCVMLKRLKSERLRLKLSQEQLGQKIGMSGNHYGKAENGTRYFSNAELKLLYATDIDMQYIFTGVHASSQYIDILIDLSFKPLLDIIQLFPIVSNLYHDIGYPTRNYIKEFYSFGCLPILNDSKKSLFWAYRKWLDITQKEMADRFGIEIKTYCKLEKKRSSPNSYMVYALYQMSLLPPAILIESEQGLRITISSLLAAMNTAERNTFLNFISGLVSTRL